MLCTATFPLRLKQPSVTSREVINNEARPVWYRNTGYQSGRRKRAGTCVPRVSQALAVRAPGLPLVVENPRRRGFSTSSHLGAFLLGRPPAKAPLRKAEGWFGEPLITFLTSSSQDKEGPKLELPSVLLSELQTF